jgi:hypothetical protein
VRARSKRLKLTLELGKRARQLLAPCGVCRRLELTAEFRVRQAERFGAPQLLGVTIPLRHRASRALFFPLVHPFLDAVLCVDKSFTCVCHLHLLVLSFVLLATPYPLRVSSYQ